MLNDPTRQKQIEDYFNSFIDEELKNQTDPIVRHRTSASFLWESEKSRNIREQICQALQIDDGGLHWMSQNASLKARLIAFEDDLIQKGKSEPEFLQRFSDYVLKEHPSRYDLMAKIADRPLFFHTLKAARDMLKADFAANTNAFVFYGLADFAQEPRFKKDVDEFFQCAFDQVRTYTAQRSGTFELLNASLFNALFKSIDALQDPAFGNLVLNEFLFCSQKENHYELRVEAGTAAITLAQLQHQPSIPRLQQYLIENDSDEADYVFEVRYALWILKRDSDGAVEFLKNPRNTTGLGYAAIALADLNSKGNISAITTRRPEIDNPVTLEIFNEAVHRLQMQTEPPEPANRTIRMFGTIPERNTWTGTLTDNVFVRRAQAKTGKFDLDFKMELDDGPEPDIQR